MLSTGLNPAPSWTHDSIPQPETWEEAIRSRWAGRLRTFVRLLEAESGTRAGLVERVLGGSWWPPPLPLDLHPVARYPGPAIRWIILSGRGTGSQLHIDPDLQSAWSLLLLGAKANF